MANATRTSEMRQPTHGRALGARYLIRSLLLLSIWSVWGSVGAVVGHDAEPPLPGAFYGNATETQDDLTVTTGVDGGERNAVLEFMQPQNAASTLRTIGLITILSLAPAVALMTTSYIRVAIVLMLLRQGLGVQGLPPNQMISALALFISAVIMTPVWTTVYEDAIVPYTVEQRVTLDEAWSAGVQPVRRFMSRQIDALGNSEDVWLFYRYLPQQDKPPESYDDVPLTALVPAFMLSELKTAFLIGFQIYLPFLILDMLVASVTVSMGMFMLPPAFVSLPFKLLLFVMVDGWHLLVEMLLQSFVPYA